jgi:hypothetical protein
MLIRRYSLVLLIGFLVTLTGFGNIAHALSNDCIGLHCEDHILPNEHSAVAKSSGDVSFPSHHHAPESSRTEECNPFICQAVVLLHQNAEAAQGQRDIDPEFQVRAQAKLNEPDSLYRPPDL